MAARALVLLSCLCVAFHVQGTAQGIAPLLAWRQHGDSMKIDEANGASVVSYVQEDAQASIVEAIKLAGGAGAKEGRSSLLPLVQEQLGTVVLFLGTQLDTAALSRAGNNRLSGIVKRAQSSVVLPYATGGQREDILKELEGASIRVQALGCQQGQTSTPAELQQALQHRPAAGQPRVIAVCSPPSSPAESALDAELQLLESVHQTLDQQGLPFLMIYTAPQPPTSSRRSTLSSAKGFGPYKECGQLCQTQVKWLQGILTFLFMALAAGAGMTCLSLLDTPSRFERPKEGGSAS